MWKRFCALFVLAIFLLSMVPLAFAEEGIRTRLTQRVQDVNDSENTTDDSVEGAGNATPMLIRARTQERLETAKENIAMARERYEQAKERYLSVKDAYMAKKNTFLEAKEQYKNCKDIESEECGEKRERIKSNAQPYLLKVADLVLSELEKIKAKVEASEDLSEEEIAEIVADIESKIQDVEDAKAVIENLDEESTREEINEAAEIIRDAWKDSKVALKKHAGRMVNARLGNIIHRTEMLETKLESIRDRLESKGADVSDLDDMLEEFNAQIELANEKYEEGKALWLEAKTSEDVDNAAKEARAILTEAKDALQNARDMLRDIVKEIRDLNRGSLDVEDGEENEESSEDVEDAGEE